MITNKGKIDQIQKNYQNLVRSQQACRYAINGSENDESLVALYNQKVTSLQNGRAFLLQGSELPASPSKGQVVFWVKQR